MHFTTDKYDALKYNWKVRASKDSFEKRNDKYSFYKLSKMDDVEHYLLANMLIKPDIWIGDLFKDSSKQAYESYCKRNQALTYHFSQEIKSLNEDFNSNFLVKNGQYPKLLRLFNQNKISFESMIILESIVHYMKHWDSIDDTIIWPGVKRKIEKYKPFVNFDEKNFRELLKKTFA